MILSRQRYINKRSKFGFGHFGLRGTALCALVTVLLLLSSSPAQSVTVCDSGCDFTTIADALASVGNGANTITVLLPYSAAENITVGVGGGDPDNPLTIQGVPGYLPTLVRLYLTKSNIVVRNLHFEGILPAYYGEIQVAANTHNMTIDNCTFFTNVKYVSPLNMAHSSLPLNENVVVTNNSFRNIGYPVWVGGHNVLFQGNVLDNNATTDSFRGDMFWTWGDNVIIRNNEFKNLEAYGLVHVDFLQVNGPTLGANNFLYENNYVHDGASQFLQLASKGGPNYGNWTIRNNVFRNIQYRANIGMDNVKFYNNIFDNVDWEPAHRNGGAIAGFSDGTDSCNGLEIINNISIGRQLWLPATGTGSLPASCAGSITDYNLITSSSFGSVANQTQIAGIAGGKPGFVDYAGGDYHLTASSPALDAGESLPDFNWDKDGNNRPQGNNWDMGPYEFRSIKPKYPIVLGIK